MTESSESQRIESPKELGFWATLKSVLWAMIGIRARGQAQQDFTRGKASHFIIIGIGFALIFILLLVLLVQAVIPA